MKKIECFNWGKQALQNFENKLQEFNFKYDYVFNSILLVATM